MTALADAPDPRFWDRIADRYARSPIGDEAAYEEKLRLTQAVLSVDAQVLELGCGTGGTAMRHAPIVAHVHATDVSEKMLDHGRRRQRDAGIDNVSFEQAAVETLEAAPGSYDAVLALSLLHLVERPEEALRRIHGWTRPGGVFVSSTACLADGMSWLRPILAVGRWIGRVPFVQFLSQDRLVEMIAEAGFEVERVWRPGPRAATFVIARRPA